MNYTQVVRNQLAGELMSVANERRSIQINKNVDLGASHEWLMQQAAIAQILRIGWPVPSDVGSKACFPIRDAAIRIFQEYRVSPEDVDDALAQMFA